MSDFRQSKLQDRFRNDPVFHAIVVAMERMISEHGLTHSEMREALFCAQYKYECENPHAIRLQITARMEDLLK